jgi:tRNA pseudouridine38-40 synthase
MIRIIVGSFIDRAAGRLELSLPEILSSRDRLKAGHTAPPDGLYFRTAYYPDVPDLHGIGLSLLRDYPVFGNSLFKQKLLRLQNSLPPSGL